MPRDRRHDRAQRSAKHAPRVEPAHRLTTDDAVKYAADGKQLRVSLRRDPAHPDRVLLSVADRGPGIPPESRARLFEPYYRTADAMQTDTSGLGLGLAIVKLIIDAHGGRVGADSRPSGGACVWFELAALADLA